MDQHSNFKMQVVQGDFPIKYGPITLKHPWSFSYNHWAIAKLDIKMQWEINLFTFFLFIDQNAMIFFSYVTRYAFQQNLLLELILDLWKCLKKKNLHFHYNNKRFY